MKNIIRLTFLAFVLVGAQAAQAQTSTFTYQGNLTDGVTTASGTYQMEFALFDALSGGTQQGSTITNNAVSVVNGVFTVQLDFTAAPFVAGANRWLQISVKKSADAGFTTLNPRQQLTASPYSIRTLSAGASDSLSASCVQCVTDGQIAGIAGSKVSGTVASATNATTATTAGNVTGVVAIANGGTGSSTQNFVDLSTTQTVGGNKTFSNNVTVNGTFSATLGQTVNTVTGTAGVTITPATAATLVPGLTQTLNVPAGYSAYVVTDGGLGSTATAATGFSTIDVGIYIDNALPTNGGYERVQAANTTGLVQMIRYWRISIFTPLTAGSHTFEVRAAGTGTGSNATVSGNNSSVFQGQLTVILVRN